MADLDAYAEALAQDLSVELGGAEVSHGPRTGKAVDKPKAALFWDGETELASAVIVSTARLVVRYWPATAKMRNDAPSGVRSPTELLAARSTLKAFLQTKQTAYASTGVWYSRLVRISPDYDPEEWGVEAELLLVFENEAVIA